MTGKVDAFDMQAGAAGYLHVKERERDWNTGPPIENFVEEAVTRILVRGLVAGELQLAEQIIVQRQDTCVVFGIDPGRGLASSNNRVGDAHARLTPIHVELVEIRTGVQSGIF